MLADEINKSSDSVGYELNLSKKQLLDRIQERIKNYNWTNFLSADNVDYTEFYIDSEKIKIKRRPTVLTTWAEIDLFIEEIDDGKTRLNFEIISFNKLFPRARVIMIGFGAFLTLFAVLINRSINTLLIIVFGWTIMSLFMYFRMRFEKYMMFKYTRLIIKDLA